MIIPISATGKGLAALEKAILMGTQLIIELPKNLKRMKLAVEHVNKLFERLAVNLRLSVNPDATLETVVLSSVVGAVAGAGIALLAGIPLFIPVLIGAVIGAASEVIEVDSVKTGLLESEKPGVLVKFKKQ